MASAEVDTQCEPLIGLCASISVDYNVTDFSNCRGGAFVDPEFPATVSVEAPPFHDCYSYGGLGTVTNGGVLLVTGAGSASFTGGYSVPLACQGIGGCSGQSNGYAISYDGLFCVVGSFTGFAAAAATPTAVDQKGPAC